jgi:hypothetical protein
MRKTAIFLFLFISSLCGVASAQTLDSMPSTDTLLKKSKEKKNTSPGIHSPRKATMRSAILPGWGQYYNKKYWKIPLVYAAIGTCAGLFYFNLNEYQNARDAYRYKMDSDPTNDLLIKDKFKPVDPESIRRYRNDVRQNVDYSVLAFLVCWGLNVVDATVDGHLKSFEVSENLSIELLPPRINPVNGYSSAGIRLNWQKKK